MPVDLWQAAMLVAAQMLVDELALLLTLEQLLRRQLLMVQQLEVGLQVKPDLAVMAQCYHALHALSACKHRINS